MVQNAETLLILAALLKPDVITDPNHQSPMKLPLVEISITTSHIFTVSGQMRAHEAQCAVHQLEANGCTALVAHHAQKTCCCCGCWELHSPNTPTHHILQTLTE